MIETVIMMLPILLGGMGNQDDICKEVLVEDFLVDAALEVSLISIRCYNLKKYGSEKAEKCASDIDRYKNWINDDKGEV